MAVPQNKNELLNAINVNFEKLLKDLHAVPLSLALTPSMEGHVKGTEMSPANLVSYLLGWNELVLRWLERDAAGETVDFPETGFRWNELGRLAQKFYGDYDGVPYRQLVDRLAMAKARIVATIEARSEAELYGRAWYGGKWSMGRMIQFNMASPYANASRRLRKWLRAKSS